MNATEIKPVLIDKDMVNQLQFPQDEILETPQELAKRINDLTRALTLGNVHHNKVRIIFADNEGLKMVETTIWAITDERIVLKSGMVVPINRIQEIIT